MSDILTEVERAKMAKLPSWARVAFKRFEGEMSRLQRERQEVANATTGQRVRVLMERVPIPKGEVEFDTAHGLITVARDKDGESLVVKSHSGYLAVRPRAANVVELDASA